MSKNKKRNKGKKNGNNAQAPATITVNPPLAEPKTPPPAAIATPEPPPAPKEERTLRLLIPPGDKTDASLLFRWCLSSRVSKNLKQRRVFHPFLLVAVAEIMPEGADSVGRLKEAARYLYPLDQGWGKIVFSHPGEFLVHAAILFRYNEAKLSRNAIKYELARHFLTVDSYGEYNHRLINHQIFIRGNFRTEKISDLDCHSDINCHEELTVVVGEEAFAKEPPAWLARLVNFGHERQPPDQCAFRRRLIVTLAFKFWFFLLVWLPLRTSFGLLYALLLFLIGSRHISLKPLFRPLTSILDSINSAPRTLFGDAKNFWTLTKKDGERRSQTLAFLTTPGVWLLAFIVCRSLIHSKFINPPIFPNLTAIIGASVVILLILVLSGATIRIVPLLVSSFAYIWRKAFPQRYKTAAEAQAHTQELRERRELEEKTARDIIRKQDLDRFYGRRVEPLVCPAAGSGQVTPDAADINNLPPSHRTVYLGLVRLKTRVCRPFRQR